MISTLDGSLSLDLEIVFSGLLAPSFFFIIYGVALVKGERNMKKNIVKNSKCSLCISIGSE